MTIRGAWGARTGWVRRALTGGRFASGPADPKDGILVGAASPVVTEDTASPGRLYFDPTTGTFLAGRTVSVTGSQGSIAIGTKATASARNAVAIATGSSDGSATASGIGSLAIQVGDTFAATASGGGAVCIGHGSSSSAVKSWAFGSSANASAAGAFAFGTEGSNNNNAAGEASFVFGGGCQTQSAAQRGFVHGVQANATRYGQHSRGFGQFAALGDAQWSQHGLRGSTTDATPTELTLFGQATTYLTATASRVMAGRIQLVARRTDVQGDNAAWPLIQFAIARDSSGNCRLLGAVTGDGTTTLSDAGASTWSVAVTADTVNQRLAITVTGEAGKTIRWVASADLVEVGG